MGTGTERMALLRMPPRAYAYAMTHWHMLGCRVRAKAADTTGTPCKLRSSRRQADMSHAKQAPTTSTHLRLPAVVAHLPHVCHKHLQAQVVLAAAQARTHQAQVNGVDDDIIVVQSQLGVHWLQEGPGDVVVFLNGCQQLCTLQAHSQHTAHNVTGCCRAMLPAVASPQGEEQTSHTTLLLPAPQHMNL